MSYGETYWYYNFVYLTVQNRVDFIPTFVPYAINLNMYSVHHSDTYMHCSLVYIMQYHAYTVYMSAVYYKAFEEERYHV